MTTQKHIVVIGASVGGLVAAAELHAQGFKVTIVEKGQKVGGLFNKVQTPFGMQELGMHVLYVKDDHQRHLKQIFGGRAFHVLTGTRVDIGASNNFGSTSFNSVYPVIQKPLRGTVLQEMINASGSELIANNAEQEATRRFGKTASERVVVPALEKLWKQSARKLSSDSIHCFFDLRRLVVCDKQEADKFKRDAWLNQVLANPDQLIPAGRVFDGRKGLVVRAEAATELNEKALRWAESNDIDLKLSACVAVENGVVKIGDRPLSDEFDAAILSMPLHSLASESLERADSLEMSIYYLQARGRVRSSFPSYYILCHDSSYHTSRIVNFDGYSCIDPASNNSVLAAEVLHEKGRAPEMESIAREVQRAVPAVEILKQYKLDKTLSVLSPTLKNAEILDGVTASICQGQSVPMYFTGMRTDKGIFFSHHTVGLAYEAALDCKEQLT